MQKPLTCPGLHLKGHTWLPPQNGTDACQVFGQSNMVDPWPHVFQGQMAVSKVLTHQYSTEHDMSMPKATCNNGVNCTLGNHPNQDPLPQKPANPPCPLNPLSPPHHGHFKPHMCPCQKNANYHIRPDSLICPLASRLWCHQACWHLGQVRSGPIRLLAFGSGYSQPLGILISRLASG